MLAIAKRNLKIYFHNKAGVFFSLMGAWIAFGLYIIFLQKNMIDAWSSVSHPEKMLDQWVMGGVLAVTSITATWTGVAHLVNDKESRKLEDFLLTDSSTFKLNLGYLGSAITIGLVMQMAMFAIMSAYFYWQDKLTFDFDKSAQILGLMLLSSILSATLGLILVQFIKSLEVAERLSVIIGTVSGFLVGVYMPVGSLPDFAQSVIKITPGAYVAAAYRQILIKDNLIQWNQPGLNIKEYLGIGLKLKDLTSLNQNLLIIFGISLASLLILFLLILAQKARKR